MVWWKKKKNNEYNVVILFMRGVPAIPHAYPTRCVLRFNIHPGKEKTQLPVMGPSTATQRALGQQRDSRLNSLMIALQVEKSQKNILQRPRGDAVCQERAEEFFNRYQNTQPCPPLTLVCEHHAMGSSLKIWTDAFHQQPAERFKKNNSVFVYVYLCAWRFFMSVLSHFILFTAF